MGDCCDKRYGIKRLMNKSLIELGVLKEKITKKSKLLLEMEIYISDNNIGGVFILPTWNLPDSVAKYENSEISINTEGSMANIKLYPDENGGANYIKSLSVDWGDGTTTKEAQHVYTKSGTFIIKVYGEKINNFNAVLLGERGYLIEGIKDIRYLDTSSMYPDSGILMFYGMISLEDISWKINLGPITNLHSAFAKLYSLRDDPSGSFANMDVSKVINMANMFRDSKLINFDASGWDVSNVQEWNFYAAGAISWTLPKPNFPV